MRQTLGIDTGGTYTDSVLLDPSSGEVQAKSKALTTPADLSVGIGLSIAGLEGLNPESIGLVSLSTTLATNAVVEGHGGLVALLLIGYDRSILELDPWDKRMPVETTSYIRGGHDVKGEEVCPLDIEAAREVILASRAQVEAFAVSGYFSVMNPDHERVARDLISELTDLPIVCGHQLSSKLNAVRRASTAVLNARLLPLIKRLLDAVKEVLREAGIGAPLMLVNGDGSLVSERAARKRPAETVLSGPAASAIGAQFLAGLDDAIVVDIGGTTTDIAILEDGQLWTNPSGARVGGWETHVSAADLRTIGLGGDSHVRVEHGHELRVGPQRAIPLCRLGAEYPAIVRDLEAAALAGMGRGGAHSTDYLVLAGPAADLPLSAAEQAILRALSAGPRLIWVLARSPDVGSASPDRLEALGAVRRAGLTPTDLLWTPSAGLGGSRAAARAGAQVVAKQLGISESELARRVFQHAIGRIAREIIDKLVEDSTGASLFPAPKAWDCLLQQALRPGDSLAIDCQLQVRMPIVAVGAPAPSLLPQVAERLGTKCIIPDHAEVGGAVGAAVGGVTHTVDVFVQPHVLGAGTATYLIHSPEAREEVRSFDRAVRRAEEIATHLARRAAYRSGAEGVSVHVSRRRLDLGTLSEVTIRAVASGKPRLATS